MKYIFTTILLLFFASCAPRIIPRAVVVDTKALVDTAGAVEKSSGEVSKTILKVSESTERAAEKARNLLRKNEIVREKAPADPELQKALAEQEAATLEVIDELDITKLHVKALAVAKAKADGDILTLQYVVSDVVSTAAKANKAAAKLEETAIKYEKNKDKLNWWRWYGVIATGSCVFLIGGYVFFRVSKTAMAVYLRTAVPILR